MNGNIYLLLLAVLFQGVLNEKPRENVVPDHYEHIMVVLNLDEDFAPTLDKVKLNIIEKMEKYYDVYSCRARSSLNGKNREVVIDCNASVKYNDLMKNVDKLSYDIEKGEIELLAPPRILKRELGTMQSSFTPNEEGMIETSDGSNETDMEAPDHDDELVDMDEESEESH